MVVTGRIADRITDPDASGDTIEEMIADGDYDGMQSFDQSLLKLVLEGQITLQTALAAASSPHDLKVSLQKAIGDPVPVAAGD
jgi:twitching motility protein PilT